MSLLQYKRLSCINGVAWSIQWYSTESVIPVHRVTSRPNSWWSANGPWYEPLKAFFFSSAFDKSTHKTELRPPALGAEFQKELKERAMARARAVALEGSKKVV